VHPFLYGILPSDEGTPLVSLAFRIELDALAVDQSVQDDAEDEGVGLRERIVEIFRRFPPRRSEFHFVSLAEAREWYDSKNADKIPVALFDGETWRVLSGGKDGRTLRPGIAIVLPTLAGRDSGLRRLLAPNGAKPDLTSSDVLEGVSTERPLYWRRVVQLEAGDHKLLSTAGALHVEPIDSDESSERTIVVEPGANVPSPSSQEDAWRIALPSYKLNIGTTVLRFEYMKPHRQITRQLLSEHLNRADADARRIARALAPNVKFLEELLSGAAKVHDEGKREPKWQWAMGNPDLTYPVAKPLIDPPLATGGFRHEWKSLLDFLTRPPSFSGMSTESEAQMRHLWSHLIASHHGYLRPWLAERVLEAHSSMSKKRQSAVRLESAGRFARLQRRIGPWRLAYLEALLKSADVTASRSTTLEDDDEQ
jgi:CRISPR-associated helicase Cas3